LRDVMMGAARSATTDRLLSGREPRDDRAQPWTVRGAQGARASGGDPDVSRVRHVHTRWPRFSLSSRDIWKADVLAFVDRHCGVKPVIAFGATERRW